jgi:hypothetical protein
MEALKTNDRKLGYEICTKPEINELKHGQFIPTPRCKFSVNIPPPVSTFAAISFPEPAILGKETKALG